jgi:hypothetical protein
MNTDRIEQTLVPNACFPTGGIPTPSTPASTIPLSQ